MRLNNKSFDINHLVLFSRNLCVLLTRFTSLLKDRDLNEHPEEEPWCLQMNIQKAENGKIILSSTSAQKNISLLLCHNCKSVKW